MNNLRYMIKVASEDQEKKGIPWGHIGAGAAGLGLGALAMYGGHRLNKYIDKLNLMHEAAFYSDVSQAFKNPKIQGMSQDKISRNLVHTFTRPKGSEHVIHSIDDAKGGKLGNTFTNMHEGKFHWDAVPDNIRKDIIEKGHHIVSHSDMENIGNHSVAKLFIRHPEEEENIKRLAGEM